MVGAARIVRPLLIAVVGHVSSVHSGSSLSRASAVLVGEAGGGRGRFDSRAWAAADSRTQRVAHESGALQARMEKETLRVVLISTQRCLALAAAAAGRERGRERRAGRRGVAAKGQDRANDSGS